MPTQVYAVVYSNDGRFLLFIKNSRGYFFNSGGGSILPNGQTLNGGGNYAFPGGQLKLQETPLIGARRELQEETGIWLDGVTATPTPFHGVQNPTLDYWGVYLRTDNIKALEGAIQSNLDQGTAAADKVIDKTYGVGQYNALMGAFPNSPADNELDSVLIQSLIADWNSILAWQNSNTLGWYYTILANLKAALGCV